MSNRAFRSILCHRPLAALQLCWRIVARSPSVASPVSWWPPPCWYRTRDGRETIDENLWVTNGPISAVVRDGGAIYIGGRASPQVGPATGGVFPIDTVSGALPHRSLKVTGIVSAVVSRRSRRLVHREVSPSWEVLPGPTLGARGFGPVGFRPGTRTPTATSTPTAVSGSTVYAGGDFTSIGGQTRNYIAALDATTGAATAWNPNASGARLRPGGERLHRLRGRALHQHRRAGAQQHRRARCHDRGGHRLEPERQRRSSPPWR